MRGDALRSLQVQVTQRLHGSSLEIQGEDTLMRVLTLAAAFQVQGSRRVSTSKAAQTTTSPAAQKRPRLALGALSHKCCGKCAECLDVYVSDH